MVVQSREYWYMCFVSLSLRFFVFPSPLHDKRHNHNNDKFGRCYCCVGPFLVGGRGSLWAPGLSCVVAEGGARDTSPTQQPAAGSGKKKRDTFNILSRFVCKGEKSFLVFPSPLLPIVVLFAESLSLSFSYHISFLIFFVSDDDNKHVPVLGLLSVVTC